MQCVRRGDFLSIVNIPYERVVFEICNNAPSTFSRMTKKVWRRPEESLDSPSHFSPPGLDCRSPRHDLIIANCRNYTSRRPVQVHYSICTAKNEWINGRMNG
jgi:hypothetical protein